MYASILNFTGLIQEASIVVQKACQLIGDDNRKGGTMCVLELNGVVRFSETIGSISTLDRMEKYFRFAEEKGRRLSTHPEHLTSYTSRNDELEQYQGAIFTSDLIFSFSGLPAKWDEACMMVVAYRRGYLTSDQWKAIIAESGNDVADRLLTACISVGNQ